MAKRTPRSEANETTSTTPVPARPPAASAPSSKGRRARAKGASAAAAPPAIAPDETFAARASAVDLAPSSAADEKARSVSMGSEPSEEDIRLRAYQRYLERGAQHGRHFEDWVEAEHELKEHR